jgi:hypothetical protein
MTRVLRFRFPEDAEPREVENDVCLAIFTAECLYGRPRTRLEVSYLFDADGSQCVIDNRGPAGEMAVHVFVGLCGERFGEAGYEVEPVRDHAE